MLEKQQNKSRLRSYILGSVAALCLTGAPALADTDADLHFMTFNTWFEQFRNDVDQIAPLFLNGGYDVIAFQELWSESYLSGLQQRLSDAGLGEYTYIKQGDTGILTRLEGALDTNTEGDSVSFQTTEAAGGVPEVVLGSVHLDYRDTSDQRLEEISGITAWAQATNRSVVLVGDYNAADVSERRSCTGKPAETDPAELSGDGQRILRDAA